MEIPAPVWTKDILRMKKLFQMIWRSNSKCLVNPAVDSNPNPNPNPNPNLLRWEEAKYEPGVKWKFLEHKGPSFPPEFQSLPDNVRFYYNGE